jgi:hypothetical protein
VRGTSPVSGIENSVKSVGATFVFFPIALPTERRKRARNFWHQPCVTLGSTHSADQLMNVAATCCGAAGQVRALFPAPLRGN